MYLTSVKIRNFRCYGQETTISLERFTTLVGRNDAGKSTVLEALGVFFGQLDLELDDFTIRSTGDMEITCSFINLPNSITLDTNCETSFQSENLLTTAGELVIVKRFARGAKPSQAGTWLKCIHPLAPKYSDLLKLKNTELKDRAEELEVDLSGIDLRKNPLLRAAIWNHSPDLQMGEREILI
jgi:hypothetical protein